MAVNFSSDDEYIDIRSPSQVDLVGQTDGAVLSVFKMGAVGTDDRYLFNVGAAFNETVLLRVDGTSSGSPSKLKATWRTPDAFAQIITSVDVDDGSWHWALFRRTGGSNFELHLDGSLVGSESNANVGTAAITPSARLGALHDDGTLELQGDLARTCVWMGDAPTQAEAQSFIDDPTQVPAEASLAAHWELWEGGTDWSNHGWHGDGNGTASAVDHPPTSFMGRYDPMWSRTTAIMDDAAFDVSTDSQGVVHAVGHRGGDLVHRKSTDGGQTWGTETVIDAGTTYYAMQYGALHIDGGVLHLLTAQGDMGPTEQPMYYWRSEDGGSTWTGPNEIDDTNPCHRSNIFAANGRIYVLGGHTTNEDVFLFWSDDDGATWTTKTLATNRWVGWGAARGDTVHIVYNQVVTTDGAKAFYLRSTDQGANFSSEEPMAPDPTSSDDMMRSRVAVNQNNEVVVAWEHRPGGTETDMLIKARQSSDVGLTFSSPIDIFPSSGDDNNGHHELRAHKGLFVCAQANEDPQQVPENAIEYKYSLDGGVTWQGWEVALNRVGEADVVGGLALSDDTVHVLNAAAGTLPQYARRSLSDIAVAPQRRSVTLLNA